MNYEAGMLGKSDRLEYAGEAPARRRWIWIIGAIAIVVIIAIAAYAMRGGSQDGKATAGKGDAAKGGDAALPTVTYAIPGRSTIQTVITGTGSLAARRDMPIGVAGEGGLVTRVLVEPGQWVRAGQVLATVDRSVQVNTAESLAAQIRVARADAALAQAELERAQQLVGRGFISKADVDRRTATRDAANARVRVAEASLNETRARNARLDIRAPAAGLVLTRTVEPGQIVSAGSGVLFRMAQNGQMEMRVQLAEGDIQRVRVGSVAEVTPVGTTDVFKGEVWQVSPIIDPQNRQGIVRVALTYNEALRPGGFASARIIAGGQVAPMLPQSAIQSDPKGNFVYVLDKENRAKVQYVTTGDVTDQGVVITGGLNGTERVVLTAGGFLNPDQKVKPVAQQKTK
ncbi:efflux RND transporter periplasmic adaptor subunit [Nostoc sp. 3335mG]|nr:efflux RND transporter periplasmic adaptor subunit [Nostoc sp. 3335mG]